MKTNAVRGDEIKSFAEIRQRNLVMDPRNHAAHVQKCSRASEEWLIIGVKAEAFVSEKSADVKEVTGPTAKIENPQGRRAIEPQILGAFHINADPVVGVLKPVDLSRIRPIRVAFPQSGELWSVNRRQNAVRVHWMRPAAGVFPKTLEPFEGKELLEFPRQLHHEIIQLGALQTRCDQVEVEPPSPSISRPCLPSRSRNIAPTFSEIDTLRDEFVILAE